MRAFRGMALRWFSRQDRADAPATIPVLPVGRRRCNGTTVVRGNARAAARFVYCSLPVLLCCSFRSSLKGSGKQQDEQDDQQDAAQPNPGRSIRAPAVSKGAQKDKHDQHHEDDLDEAHEPRFPNNAGDEPCVDLRLATLPEGINPRGRRAHGFGTYRASGNNEAQLNQALRAIAQASRDAPLCPSVSGPAAALSSGS
jgi:hypothetical protein